MLSNRKGTVKFIGVRDKVFPIIHRGRQSCDVSVRQMAISYQVRALLLERRQKVYCAVSVSHD